MKFGTHALIGLYIVIATNVALAQATTATAPTGAATPASPATPSVGSTAAGSVAAPAAADKIPVGQNPVPTPSAEQLAPIYVTGSAIPTTDAEGSLPVTVVDSATIERRGYQTATDILRNVPANGSFSSPGQTSGAFAGGASYVSLRGLGPQATLVLINGRRANNYASAANGQYGFVDLNSIPAEIIDRVEVLTEGTAIYGADAVAGVVNIITKKSLDDENGHVDLYIGNTDNRDEFTQRYTVMGNLGSFDKNGFGVVEADYSHQNSIFAGDRQISRSADQSPNGGFDLRSGRTFPGIFQVNNAGTPGDLFSLNPGTGNVPLTGTTNATDPHVNDDPFDMAGYDYNPPTSIIPETERWGFYMNYTYKFYDGNITPNIDFDYRHNRTILTQAAAGYSEGDTGPSEFSSAQGANVFQVPMDNPYNHTGQVIDILSYRFVQNGPRIEDVDNDVFRAIPSVDIKLGDGWTLNAGFNFQYSYVNDRNVNFPSATAFQNALNSTDVATAYNPFTSVANNNQAIVNNLFVSTYNRDTTSLVGTDFRFNGKLFDLPAGPVQMAFGGEYRIERFNQAYGPADLTGDVIGSTVQLDIAASRKDLAGYTELDIPITSPSFNVPGFYQMDVKAAARVDKYSTFGSGENPQVSLRLETVPGLVLRASYSKAFRAPSLPELFAGSNQSVVEIVDPIGGGTARDVTVNGGGNPKLHPETAEIFSGGVAYSPDWAKGLLITSDFFKIRYNNQILQQDPQTLIDEGSSQVVHNPVDGSIASITATYANQAESYVQGIDWGVSYVMGNPFQDYGQFTFQVNGTLLLDYILDDGTGAHDFVGEDSGGVGPYSRYRQDASITWDFHNFEFTLSNDYSSGYSDTSVSEFGIERSVAALCTFDLQASYTFEKEEMSKWMPLPKTEGFDWQGILAGTRVAIGCNNVYDFQPPFTANTADTLGYDPGYADPTGRFLYGEITKKF